MGFAGTGYTVGIARAHVQGYQNNDQAQLMALYDMVPGGANKWAEEMGLKEVIICESYQ